MGSDLEQKGRMVSTSGYLRNPRAGCHCNGKWPGATPRRTSSLPTYEAQMKKKTSAPRSDRR